MGVEVLEAPWQDLGPALVERTRALTDASAMTPLAVGSRRFRVEREADWGALEALLDRAERRSLRGLSDDDLAALPRLYRAAVSSLSVAQATSLDADLIQYLEALAARGLFLRLRRARQPRGAPRRLPLPRLPAAVRALAAKPSPPGPALAGYARRLPSRRRDPGWYAAFVPTSSPRGRTPEATAAALSDALRRRREKSLTLLRRFLFTNNAHVAIAAFALGFAVRRADGAADAVDRAMLGAVLRRCSAAAGSGFDLGGWLAIHGTTELFAVILAGAAGFRIARAVIFPGAAQSRRCRADGRPGSGVRDGRRRPDVVVAAALEGFGRQLITGTPSRYGVAAAMLALWLGYFYLPRRP